MFINGQNSVTNIAKFWGYRLTEVENFSHYSSKVKTWNGEIPRT